MTVELKGRELISMQPPREYSVYSTRPFGVALDNDEAQDFISKGWRVFGDEEGPYLVVRVRADQDPPKQTRGDVTFEPVPWYLNNESSGIICWLKELT